MALPGVSFSPLDKGPNQSQETAPVQDAIKIMSFRMPSVVGAGAPAPQGLLGGPTAQGGFLQSGLMQALLKRLFQGQGLQMPPQEAGVTPFSASPSGAVGMAGASIPAAGLPLGSPQTTNFMQENPFTLPSAPAPSFPSPGQSFPVPHVGFGQEAGFEVPGVPAASATGARPTPEKSIFDSRYASVT